MHCYSKPEHSIPRVSSSLPSFTCFTTCSSATSLVNTCTYVCGLPLEVKGTNRTLSILRNITEWILPTTNTERYAADDASSRSTSVAWNIFLPLPCLSLLQSPLLWRDLESLTSFNITFLQACSSAVWKYTSAFPVEEFHAGVEHFSLNSHAIHTD